MDSTLKWWCQGFVLLLISLFFRVAFIFGKSLSVVLAPPGSHGPYRSWYPRNRGTLPFPAPTHPRKGFQLPHPCINHCYRGMQYSSWPDLVYVPPIQPHVCTSREELGKGSLPWTSESGFPLEGGIYYQRQEMDPGKRNTAAIHQCIHLVKLSPFPQGLYRKKGEETGGKRKMEKAALKGMYL